MLRTAREAANVFTGTEDLEHISIRQMDALLLFSWPQKHEGPGDIGENKDLGLFVNQLKSQMNLSADQDQIEVKAREKRRKAIEKGDRTHPQLQELDELRIELCGIAIQTPSKLGSLGFLDWEEHLKKAERTYIENPDDVEYELEQIRVKMLSREEKLEKIDLLAKQLAADGITAIPLQVWNCEPEDPESLTPEDKIVRRFSFVLMPYRILVV